MSRNKSLLVLLLLLVGCGTAPAPTPAPLATMTPLPTTPLPAIVPTTMPAPTAILPTATPSPAPSPAAGDRQIRTLDGMVLLYVPAGEFLMGSADDDPLARWMEQPQHPVYLDAFWVDRTEVTNAQFQRCVEAGACQVPTTCDFGELAYGDTSRLDHPVVCVTWYDAQAYCQWAGGQLPTEAQWEKAARGTDGRIFPWGRVFDCTQGNFDDETVVDGYVVPGGPDCDGYERTAPVGSFPQGASPYGALDVVGNAWEWTSDWRDWSYYQRSPYRNPAGPEDGDMRIVRGGSWHYGVGDQRAAGRHSAPPDHRADALGFRCILPAAQTSGENSS